MILAAGFGSRLEPLTRERPKPLVPWGDRPLLVHTVEKLLELGAERVVVNAHYMFSKIYSEISGLGEKVHVVHEEKILGTAGGIHGALTWLRAAPLIVVNGDIVGRLPVRELLAHATPGLHLALSAREELGTGTVGCDAEGNVVRLRGEVFGREEQSGDYMGVALLGEEALGALPARGCLIGDFALPHLRRGGRVKTCLVADAFEDLGSLTSYHRANMRWLEQTGHEFHLGTGAQVSAGVELVRSIVGAGARVEGSGVVRDCILWPGAVASAPLEGAVVTTEGLVVQVPRAELTV